MFWIIGGVLSAAVAATVLVLSLGGDDDADTAGDTTDVSVDDTRTADTDASDPTVTDAVDTTAAPTTEPAPTTTAAPLVLPSTIVPVAEQVDLGSSVAYTLPDGFTQEPVNNGVEITDGTIRFFAQVATRKPGDDPLLFAQEYIDSFESTFASSSFSQAIPATADDSGAAPSDGYFIYYRVMNTDGTGFRGLIDATRRADGLVYLTDIYRAIDDDSGDVLPDGVYDEFYSAFLEAPLVGDPVALTPLALARPSSSKPTFPLDGVVALSPPSGWTVELPGPGRVAFSTPTGQRFAVARLADTADPLIAQDLAFAALQVALPGATIEGFEPSREDEAVISFDTSITATDAASGRAIEGIVRVWIDTVRSQVFAAVSSNFTDTPPNLADEDFIISALDLSLVDDH
jgi:hypothetical protein